MNGDRKTRVERATLAAQRAGQMAARRGQAFYEARNGITVKLTREEEAAALARVK